MSVSNIERIADIIESGTLLQLSNGIECVDTHEMFEIIDMIKDLAEAKYRCQIVDAMREESTYPLNDDDWDDWDRVYFSRMRDSKGRFMPKHYSEPNYHMSPEMYKSHSAEELRDMDRKHGRMYYTEPNAHEHESRYDMARKNYTEHKDANPSDTQSNLKAIESLTSIITEDIKELLPKMNSSEKTMLKTKMQNMLGEIS